MNSDNIIEIGIDTTDRLYIKPERENFILIWRSATEVHWDNKGRFLYSPTPREWSYLDWYRHIISVIETEGYCKLRLTRETKWINIPEKLKAEIIDFDKTNFA